MVYSKPNPTTGAMKRSASALEGPPGWDVAPPMMTHSRSSFRPPYTHYAMIYLDHDGKLKVDESSSIQEHNATVFSPEVRQNFLEILGERIGYHAPPRQTVDASPRRVRRRKGNAPSISEDRLSEQASDSEDFSNGSTEMVPLRIGDSQKVMAYYEGALKHFQQLNCRMVAKAFIKFIEPRKQVRHPYNGGKPPPGSAPGTTGDPEKTKPEWWPPGVMHKEPDHLRKEYRIELLLHIIRHLGSYGITADKLKEVAGDTKRSLKHPSHVEIIYEILRVRKMEERLERGEVDSNMIVYTMNRGPSPKGDEEEESNDAPSVTIEEPEHNVQGLMTPISSVEQVTAALTTPIDTLPATRSLPGSFSMPEPLSFEGPRQDRPYYTTPPQYTDSFSSQPMLSTPVTAEMISPHDVSVFDYSSHNAFPTSTPDHQRAGHYDPWAPAPTFRQNIFGTVDYNAAPSSQPMSQPSMSYHMPMAPHHMHDMSQSHVDQRSLPFRTGSLGHPHPNGLPLSHAV
ncbi:hypothetical protein N7522_007293 [Penicillium canescens]|uniref:Subtelomeric hrmA-associated cluster protein AFUB-079030/YDR124W-like helical bundle domain-containing protein n=1 Tax=Penicillium canescens TaxID=5083 RepID=A0AAD6N629_PENCN|nr:uncharacterized protein N7446_009607 [Penicillium canescens]KAJ6002066.1 hypothetical protein N7522_007293 [Penicillium canescens]KAJ6034851.1 hypothetical protein N7460_009026 [Penicillium canescens]KAJ6046515.1 hypothetical protein N7444_007769 [Penicillium canescens]KAJ6053595.1 hypothetical protein N7446_009607 [Penicillium canescens]